MIADVRNLGRHLCIFVGKGYEREHILSCAVAFAHLHRGFLRNVDVRADIVAWIGEEKSTALIARGNPADAALRSMADQISKLSKQDVISGFSLMTISQTLSPLALARCLWSYRRRKLGRSGRGGQTQARHLILLMLIEAD